MTRIRCWNPVCSGLVMSHWGSEHMKAVEQRGQVTKMEEVSEVCHVMNVSGKVLEQSPVTPTGFNQPSSTTITMAQNLSNPEAPR